MIGRVTGVVKSANRIQDFRFLELPNGDDVFVYKNVMETFGRPIVTGALVDCEVMHVPGKGYRAVEIYSCTPPEMLPPKPWLPAMVKWFDALRRGYGFVIMNDGREAFLHASTMAQCAFRFDTGRVARLPVEVQIEHTGGPTRLRVAAVRHAGRT